MLFGITAGGLASGHTLHRGRRQRLPEVGGAGTSTGGRGGGCHKTGPQVQGDAGWSWGIDGGGDRRPGPASMVVHGDFFNFRLHGVNKKTVINKSIKIGAARCVQQDEYMSDASTQNVSPTLIVTRSAEKSHCYVSLSVTRPVIRATCIIRDAFC